MCQNPPSVSELTQQLIDFRDARDWRQFHALKDLILSVSLEASELVELTQWKSAQNFEDEAQKEPMQQRLREECADVADKIKANDIKYPVEKSRGTSAKYDKL